MNWFEQIAFQAKLSPDEPAVIFPGGMATYGRLIECVENATQHVLRAGLKKGEIVALEIQHPLLHLVAILALHRCGMASLTLQTGHLTKRANVKIDRFLSDRYQQDRGWTPVLITKEWLMPLQLGAAMLPVPGFDSPDGGTKTAPEMIENILRQVPEISDAAVFAVPNSDQIWAAVVCKGQLRQNENCRQKLGGAAPDRLFVLDSIPRNDMGKIIRDEMKAKIMRKLAVTFMS